jgi:selenocysteine lyase/cysteine desulfurase
MPLDRRDLLRGLGSLAAAAALTPRDAGAGSREPSHADTPFVPGFPRKADFRIADGYTYLSGAFTHPMPIAAAEAYHAVVTRRSTIGTPRGAPPGGTFNHPEAKAAFARLINAKPNEISFLPNTSTGENLVVECLGIGKVDGNVVTDGLHFEGALVHLYELEKQGLDLRVVMPTREGRIELKDLERVVDRKTKLIEVSLVSMYNGFQHDLETVCDLAHAHGAYVYADIIQGVGAVPLDVKASGVDFAATATYKWLMGDFGLGFFYCREDLLGTVVRRPHWSYESAPDIDIHLSPLDPQSPKPVTWTPGATAGQYFELGTMAYGVNAALGVSIPYIQQLGVENIQRHRQPLIDRLQKEMPQLGFVPQTPLDSTSPIVTFAHRDAERIRRKLEAARVNVRVADYWIRIAPSVYNDMADVDRLLDALA